jgi:L-alanine-DL-glutamate epimerase and related enzymes of enolase superfamily
VQITKVEVDPIELKLRHPVQMAGLPEINHLTAIFIHMTTRQGQSAWGCTIAHPSLTGEKPDDVLRACLEGAVLAPDLHPTNIEYSLNELAVRTKASPGAMCAFDLAFHDLLGLAAGMPLYRILGGYRNRIQTSVTIPIVPIDESVELSKALTRRGFRKLKIKGGIDPAEDVRRVKAIHTALPEQILDLDADGGYTIQEALEVARALGSILEMFEQPTPPGDLAALRQIKAASPVPVLADQSLRGPASALELASNHIVDGLSIKLVACGGLRCGRQIDAIARAAHLATMVSCFIEPALLVSAGLSLALSSPNVHFGDLDGSFDLANDPSQAGFTLEDGWLVASEVPGLGYSVQLG